MTAHSITFMRCTGLRVESHSPDNENLISLEITHEGDADWDGDKREWTRAASKTRIDLFGLPDDITTKLMALADDETKRRKPADDATDAPDDDPLF